MIGEYGFRDQAQGRRVPARRGDEAIEALREAFPDQPLRLDPNAAWTPQTSVKVAAGTRRACSNTWRTRRPGSTAWPRWRRRRRCRWPPTCAWSRSTKSRRRRKDSVQVVLSDHHYWGGLRAHACWRACARRSASGLSMHSNSHLGISLAAMVHVARRHAESHLRLRHPLAVEDRGGRQGRALDLRDGSVAVPTTPGLGVELDDDALAALHEQYVRAGSAIATTRATCTASILDTRR